MDKTIEILKKHFGNITWKLEKPKDGLKKECFIATSSRIKVFIKFDVPIEPLIKLGEIGVAPKVLFSGIYENIPYVIQEFIEGENPTKEWIKINYKKVAGIIKLYHDNEELKNLLIINPPKKYQEIIIEEINKLDEQLHIVSETNKQLNGCFKLFKEFKAMSSTFSPLPLVPIHKEPNTKNMMIDKDLIFFIDWDEIALSDPLRDIGLFLWWYLPEDKWQDFLRIFNFELLKEVRDKIYWFSARSSLEIALWYFEKGNKPVGANFIRDFYASLHQQSNPEGYD